MTATFTRQLLHAVRAVRRVAFPCGVTLSVALAALSIRAMTYRRQVAVCVVEVVSVAKQARYDRLSMVFKGWQMGNDDLLVRLLGECTVK